ncbi:MAG: hypothetical protein OHK0019_12470 [Saprospiraceae bacterium]
MLALLLSSATFFSTQVFAQSGGQNPSLIMYRWNGGSISPQPVVQGNLLGTVRWDGLTGVGSIKTGASIQSFVKNPVAPGFLMGNMIFRTSGAAGLTDRVIITENGLVGIGEMNPQYHLHVLGNTHTTGDFFGRIHFDNNANTNDAPNTYIDEAYFERKNRNVLTGGLTLPVTAGDVGGILTLAPGGTSLDHQIYFGEDGMWTRRKTGNAADWTGADWFKMLTGENINGTENQLAKFTGPNALGDSRLFDNGLRVGIGNSTPATDLDISGATRINGNLGVGVLPTTFRLDVSGNSRLSGNAQVTGNLDVDSDANIDGNLQVDGNGRVDGRLVIGNPPTAPGSHMLYVNGSMIATEVKVELQGSWPDYVFSNDYSLMPLSEVEKYVQEEKHLPGIPDAEEVAENGLGLGEMQKIQMEKVEEIFLHLIELEKRMKALESQNEQLKAENATLKAQSGNGAQRN